MGRVKRITGVVVAALTGLGVSGGALLPAGADTPSSTLLASPNPIDLDFGSLPSLPVTVNLDPATCLSALQNGNSYSITATAQDSNVTATPGQQGPLKCSGDNKKGLPTQATFTVAVNAKLCSSTAGVSTASSSVLFDPVAGPHGIDNKLVEILVPVNISSVPACTTPGPGPGPANGRPAAPSVAAGYLMAQEATSPDYITTCQKNVPYKGNGWFGAVISAVAHAMPTPENVKDDTSVFPHDSDWTAFVKGGVDAICGGNFSPWVVPVAP